MILYHYTQPGTVLRVAYEGLKPQAREENAFMTGGIPVVWLTRQQSNIATADHIEHFRRRDVHGYKIGDPMFGGPARLTVHLERHNKRLMAYRDFLRKIGADLPKIVPVFTPDVLANWYVFLGDIPARKIDCALPATRMLECLDHHIATHPDPEARERFKAMREQVAPLPPDYPVGFHPQLEDAA